MSAAAGVTCVGSFINSPRIKIIETFAQPYTTYTNRPNPSNTNGSSALQPYTNLHQFAACLVCFKRNNLQAAQNHPRRRGEKDLEALTGIFYPERNLN